jgi:hypothetical protein
MHVYEGGQAIVGAVWEREGGGRAETMKNEAKPMAHGARDVVFADGTALRSQNEIREALDKPAAKGKKRCRLYIGAEGSGPPCGERRGADLVGVFVMCRN